MAVVTRLKYRPAPYEPECDVPLAGNPFAVHKKIFPFEAKKYVNSETRSTPYMLPAQTQKLVVSHHVYSDEVAVRKAQVPTIFDRVATQKAWVSQKITEYVNRTVTFLIISTGESSS